MKWRFSCSIFTRGGYHHRDICLFSILRKQFCRDGRNWASCLIASADLGCSKRNDKKNRCLAMLSSCENKNLTIANMCLCCLLIVNICKRGHSWNKSRTCLTSPISATVQFWTVFVLDTSRKLSVFGMAIWSVSSKCIRRNFNVISCRAPDKSWIKFLREKSVEPIISVVSFPQ